MTNLININSFKIGLAFCCLNGSTNFSPFADSPIGFTCYGNSTRYIANHPSHAKCNIKKYKHRYNLEHVCPKFCHAGCTVECASCKPICVVDGTSTPPSDSPPDTTPPPTSYTPPTSPPKPPQNPPPSPSTPPLTLLHHLLQQDHKILLHLHPHKQKTIPPLLSPNPLPYTAPKTVQCKNKIYSQCYNMKHVCPSSCPGDYVYGRV